MRVWHDPALPAGATPVGYWKSGDWGAFEWMRIRSSEELGGLSECFDAGDIRLARFLDEEENAR